MDELTPNQRRRALRLLQKAEAEDYAKAEAKAQQERRFALEAERMMAKQAVADDWTRRFHAIGLPLTARVQVNRYTADGGWPSIWVSWPTTATDKEDIWLTILERLEAANEHEQENA